MPDHTILAYYESVSEKILPFLRGRRVAVRHTFDSAESARAGSKGDHISVFRRHPGPSLRRFVGKSGWPEKNWIYVPNRLVLLEIVRQHGYEFFPHLEGEPRTRAPGSLRGERDLWFALDVDVRAVPLPLGKVVVRTVLDILDERKVKYLLTFSGGDGFHVQWTFSPGGVPPNGGTKRGRARRLPLQKWQFLRRIVRSLRAEAERRLQQHPQRDAFYQHIPKGDSITGLNAVDKAAQHSVLFDELILKRQATIRAPFSLHMGHRWVAVPIEPRRLEAFVPVTDATMTKAQSMSRARLPLNPVAPFLKPPWS